MRLTLRTLLAYLDDLLEPGDARELGAKVRDSEFASGLVHRIRSVIGRLRLSAPSVLGRGIGADANTVAEYLDNTFPADRVPEFEKICLESDMHLAEVASCHQVLALVLGEPAQVSTRLRDRVHGLLPAVGASSQPSPAKAFNAPHAGEGGASALPASVAETPATPPSRRDSNWRGSEYADAEPDYVATGRRPGFPSWLSGLLAGFFLTAVLVAGYAWLQGRPSELAEAPNQPELGRVNEADRVTVAPADAAPALDAETVRMDATPRPPGPAPTNVASDFEPVPTPPQLPLPPPLLAAPTQPESTAETPAAVSGADRADGAAGSVEATPHSPGRAADAESKELTIPEDSPESRENVEAKPVTVDATDALSTEGTAKVPEKIRDLGRFVSEDQLLAVWDEQQASWVRLPPRSALLSGIHLRVPTLFRPQLVLSSGLQITLNDVTDLHLSSETDRPITLALEFGQAMVSSISGEEQQLVLQVAGEQFNVKLIDGLSQFAIDVQHLRWPGANPLANPAPTLVRIWPTGGSMEIRRGDKPAQLVPVGNVWIFDGEADIRPAEKLPQWVSAPQRKEIDRLAQFRLANELGFDRPLTLSLAELAADGPTETRSLAARVLASLDRFETLVESFADPKQHFAWTPHYAALQDALARSPQTAQLVFNAAQERWGVDLEPMWSMIVGYDPASLVKRGAGQLVAALEHEQLEVRVIAIESLRRITGVDYFYEPQRLSRRRDYVSLLQS